MISTKICAGLYIYLGQFEAILFNIDGYMDVIKECDVKNDVKISKGAKIRNRYIQVPHLTQDTNG